MDNYQLIDKVLSGQASESEQYQFNAWLQADPGNQRYYEDIKLLFDHQQESDENSTSEEGWERIHSVILAERRTARHKNIIRSLVFMASLCIVFLATAYLGWKILPASANTTFATSDSASISFHLLPDSSIVALAPGSSYRYINGWDTAMLEITGRAYLIGNTAGKPLIVKTQSMNTNASRASLFVTSLPGIEKFYLEKGGRLSVRHTSQQAFLAEGFSATLADGALLIQSIDLNQEYWYLKEMTFVKTPLNEVIAQLKNNIGLTIHPEFDLGSCRFSGVFTNGISEQDVVNALCGYYGVVYEKTGARSYKLIGKPCQKR